MTIGIAGATGQLGRLVVEQLKTKIPPAEIVALARSPEKAGDLGMNAREADYERPVTLDRAFVGLDTLLLISATDVGRRATQHRNLIESAKKAGIKRIVYTSLLHADTSPLSLADEHLATEAELRASGIQYTILRNGWYTENNTAWIPGAMAGGALIGSAGDGRISFATRADFADAAVAVLTTEGHDGETYELAGDDAHTMGDLAAEASRQMGRTIAYRNLSAADYATALTRFGIPEAMAAAIAGWDVDASQGALFDDSRQLSALIGRPTTPLAIAVAEALKGVS